MGITQHRSHSQRLPILREWNEKIYNSTVQTLISESPLLEVTDGLITLYDGTIPIIFEGTTGSNKLTEQNIGKTYFRKIKRIDHNNFLIGAFHRKKQIQSLGIISKGSKDSVRFNPELLEKNKEGF
ncbi:hypothetical protein [Chryseobacterium wanjuense]